MKVSDALSVDQNRLNRAPRAAKVSSIVQPGDNTVKDGVSASGVPENLSADHSPKAGNKADPQDLFED